MLFQFAYQGAVSQVFIHSRYLESTASTSTNRFHSDLQRPPSTMPSLHVFPRTDGPRRVLSQKMRLFQRISSSLSVSYAGGLGSHFIMSSLSGFLQGELRPMYYLTSPRVFASADNSMKFLTSEHVLYALSIKHITPVRTHISALFGGDEQIVCCTLVSPSGP